MRCFVGVCCFVFNCVLVCQNENYEVGNKYIFYGKMVFWLVEWKNVIEMQWLKDFFLQPLQQLLKDFEWVYKNFFWKWVVFF